MGIEWLAESLRNAREVHGTESGRGVGRQTEENSGILIGGDQCKGSSDRWIGMLWIADSGQGFVAGSGCQEDRNSEYAGIHRVVCG